MITITADLRDLAMTDNVSGYIQACTYIDFFKVIQVLKDKGKQIVDYTQATLQMPD